MNSYMSQTCYTKKVHAHSKQKRIVLFFNRKEIIENILTVKTIFFLNIFFIFIIAAAEPDLLFNPTKLF